VNRRVVFEAFKIKRSLQIGQKDSNSQTVPNTTGKDNAMRSSKGEIGARTTRHHHGWSVVAAMVCPWWLPWPWQPPFPRIVRFSLRLSGAMRFCPFCVLILSLKAGFWLENMTSIPPLSSSQYFQNSMRPPLERLEEEKATVRKGKGLKANQEINFRH